MCWGDDGEATSLYQGNVPVFEQGICMKPPEGVLRPGGLRLTRRLVDACAFVPGAKVVDIGCGTGITVEYLRDIYGLCAAGVDLSAASLKEGRERTPDLPLICAGGEALPFAGNSFHGALAECSLSVMEDASRVLAEMNRMLVPGGKLAVTDMYIRHTGSAARTCNAAGDGRKSGVMSYDELTKTLEENGFRIIVWEDQSDALKEFVARFIMEHGSAEELWQCIAIRQKDRLLSPQMIKTRLGYYLLVAEKCRTIGAHQ